MNMSLHNFLISPGISAERYRFIAVGIRKLIAPHWAWIWAFIVIGVFLWGSHYLNDQIGAHYQRHPPAPEQFRIDRLSFWARDTEGARNLVFAIGGWLGVLAAIVGFIFSGFRTSTQLQMTQTAFDGQVTERFTKAVEQLGHKERAVRLGAIYALERIAKDSSRDRDVIVETLAAYIREKAPWPPADENGKPLVEKALEAEEPRPGVRPPIDIAAALTVICRLLPKDDPMRANVNLRRTDLRGLDAPRSDLSWMRIDYSNLSYCSMERAKLSGATLTCTNLSYADLTGVDLTGGDLFAVKLNKAHLSDVNMADVQNLIQERLDDIKYLLDYPPKNLPEGLTLPEGLRAIIKVQ